MCADMPMRNELLGRGGAVEFCALCQAKRGDETLYQNAIQPYHRAPCSLRHLFSCVEEISDVFFICELHVFYLGLIPSFIDHISQNSSCWLFQMNKTQRLRLCDQETELFKFPVPTKYKTPSPSFSAPDKAIHWRGMDYKLFSHRCPSLSRHLRPLAGRVWLLLLAISSGCASGLQKTLLERLFSLFLDSWCSLLSPRPNLHAVKHLIQQCGSFGPSGNFANWQFEKGFSHVRQLHDSASHFSAAAAGRFVLKRLQMEEIFLQKPDHHVHDAPSPLFFCNGRFFLSHDRFFREMAPNTTSIKKIGVLFLSATEHFYLHLPNPQPLYGTLYKNVYAIPCFCYNWQPVRFLEWSIQFLLTEG